MPRRAHNRAFHRRLQRCQQQPQVELDEIDVRYREHHFPPQHHSLVEICKKPSLAAEVTITAAEYLDVDAAIIFATSFRV